MQHVWCVEDARVSQQISVTRQILFQNKASLKEPKHCENCSMWIGTINVPVPEHKRGEVCMISERYYTFNHARKMILCPLIQSRHNIYVPLVEHCMTSLLVCRACRLSAVSSPVLETRKARLLYTNPLSLSTTAADSGLLRRWWRCLLSTTVSLM